MVSPAQFKTGIENHPTSIGQHDRRQPLTLSGRLLPISLAHLLVLSMTLALAVGAEASSLDTDTHATNAASSTLTRTERSAHSQTGCW